MGLFKGKRRGGAEVFGFFAGNDAQLSGYLNRLPAGERAAMIQTLDAVLGVPSKDLFESRFVDLAGQQLRTADGSEEEARLNALTRMLGYEYQRVYKGDPWELTMRAEASRGDGGDDSEDSETVFTRAARLIVSVTAQDDDVEDQDKLLSMACLSAGAAVASTLGASDSDDDDDDAIQNRVGHIADGDDLGDAGRAAWAIAWYFALQFVYPLRERIDPRSWLGAMDSAMGPISELHPLQDEEEEQLTNLYNTYLEWRDSQKPNFWFAFARWVDRHLGLDAEDADGQALQSSMMLQAAIKPALEPFHASLVELGLLKR